MLTCLSLAPPYIRTSQTLSSCRRDGAEEEDIVEIISVQSSRRECTALQRRNEGGVGYEKFVRSRPACAEEDGEDEVQVLEIGGQAADWLVRGCEDADTWVGFSRW